MKLTYKEKYQLLKKQYEALNKNYQALLEGIGSLKEIANRMIQIVKPKADPEEVAKKVINIKEEIKKIAKTEGIDEKLKSTNQMQWVQAMNNIKSLKYKLVSRFILYYQ